MGKLQNDPDTIEKLPYGTGEILETFQKGVFSGTKNYFFHERITSNLFRYLSEVSSDFEISSYVIPKNYPNTIGRLPHENQSGEILETLLNMA